MDKLDMDAPAALHWVSKEVPHMRRMHSVRDAVRVAMKDLNRTEFFSARINTPGHVFAGDEIVELFQTGGLAARRYAGF